MKEKAQTNPNGKKVTKKLKMEETSEEHSGRSRAKEAAEKEAMATDKGEI